MKEYPYIHISSRTGCFNFAKPGEESVSTHIGIREQSGKEFLSCNITTEYEETDSGTNHVISLIQYYRKRLLWSSEIPKMEAVLRYIVANDYELMLGEWQHDLVVATKKRDGLNVEISKLEKYLSGREYFEKGVWIE